MSFDGDYNEHGNASETEEFTAETDLCLQFNRLCASAFLPRNKSADSIYQSEMSWEPAREWINSHSEDDIRQAALQLGDSNMTALHFACRNGPAADIIDVLLNIVPETVQWQDSFGLLPIHYACARGGNVDVIKKLAEKLPDSKCTVDRKGRTPLHFALGTQSPDQQETPAIVAILSSTGAACLSDQNGMLPLHYACVYGATEEALYVLTDAYPDAISKTDVNNRTPLHFALSNGGRKDSPGAVRHLLTLDRRLANSIDGGPLPLRVLSDFAYTLRQNSDTIEDKANVVKCLEHLLDAEPTPTADFFTALQALPHWLREKAVVMSSVQVLLNEKIAQRFPTMFLMCDFFCLILVIIFYSLDVTKSIEKRANPLIEDNSIDIGYLVPLYLGVGYFFLREVTKILSLVSLKAFHLWLYNPSNWINVAFMALMLFWAIRMQTGSGDNDRFRTGAAFTVIVLWLKFLAFLRSMLIDFAVFVSGVLHVVQRLVAFLTALVVILVAFSQMFLTVFRQTPYCNDRPDEGLMPDQWCFEDYRPYCEFWTSFLSVYTMLLGEVDEENFKASTVATFLFCVFMFLVVILLANVLIAIVTDSYKVIQYERAAIVFWTNRLDFVAEMDAIANGPWRKRLKVLLCGCGDDDDDRQVATEGSTFGKKFWRRLMDLFDDDVEENYASTEFFAYTLLRVFTAVVIIPCWIGIGLLTAGCLWPPQVREAIFTSVVSKHSSDSAEEDELRKTQVALLQKEVTELREDLTQELAVDRTQVVQMKSQIDHRRTEIDNEMKNIKRIVTMLFEQQASMVGG